MCMNKKLIGLGLGIAISFAMVGCSPQEEVDDTEQRIAELEERIDELERDVERLEENEQAREWIEYGNEMMGE